jgi:hypothetical protein
VGEENTSYRRECVENVPRKPRRGLTCRFALLLDERTAMRTVAVNELSGGLVMCTCWNTDVTKKRTMERIPQDWFACNDHFVQYSHVDGLVRMLSYDCNVTFTVFPYSYLLCDCCTMRERLIN